MTALPSDAGERQTLLAAALQTPEAKEALEEGFRTLRRTRDLSKAWQAMIAAGQRNGSLDLAKLALIIDVLQAIADWLNKRKNQN